MARRPGDAPRHLDKRLRGRLRDMTAMVEQRPSASFPAIFKQRRTLDGAYALFSNPRVSPESVLDEHIQRTILACEKETQVLLISDSTEFTYAGDRDGLGPLGKGQRGFMGHFCLAVSGVDDRRALGVLDAHLWIRPEVSNKGLKRKGKVTRTDVYHQENKESLVWMEGAMAAEAALRGAAKAIHVMDSGADDYAQFNGMHGLGMNYVIRLKHNRTLVDAAGDQKLFEVLEDSAPTILTRKVHLTRRATGAAPPKQKRTHPERDDRQATLRVSVRRVRIKKPHTAMPDFARAVDVNVIRVFEENPPMGVEPVEWLLATNLPVGGIEHLAHVIDIYRARWLVEEYFKALKSGCATQSRQLETGEALMNMVAFFAPIAAQLLALRDASRNDPHRPASSIMDNVELKVLRRIAPTPLGLNPTVAEVLAAVARLGGHLKSNGPPGWAVLTRGYEQLLPLVRYQRLLDAAQRSPG